MRFAFVFLTAALVLSSRAAAATDINADSVIRLMNEERAKHGLSPLRSDARLEAAAVARMRHMEEEQFWSHEAPDGTSPFVWIRPQGYSYAAAAENLARGFEDAELLVASWMESRGHRGAILGAEYADCGVAVIDGYTTGPGAGKSVVVLFGNERR